MNVNVGDKVKAYDSRSFISDGETPYISLLRDCTVVCIRGQLGETLESITLGPYSLLFDVLFDGESSVSKGHFSVVKDAIRIDQSNFGG